MCGVYGFLPSVDRQRDRGVITRMGRTMQHRGPDDEVLFEDDNLMLGMKRLARIDVGGGHQPIANEDKTVITICNGEIYNFRALRGEPKKRGHSFGTGTDSEVKYVIERWGLIDWNYVQVIAEQHRANREDYTDHLLSLMNVEFWCQLYIDGDEPQELTDRLSEAHLQ